MTEPTNVTARNAENAPVVYFDGVMTCGLNGGIVNAMIVVGLVLPMPDGKIETVPSAVAHLRCNMEAAARLRDALDKALFVATPVVGSA